MLWVRVPLLAFTGVSVKIKIKESEAEVILEALALKAVKHQGRYQKWRHLAEEVINLGIKLSTRYEKKYEWDEGAFERMLGGTPVVPSSLSKEVLLIYNIPVPVPHNWKRV